MSKANPYDSFIGGCPPLAILQSTPAALGDALDRIGAAQLAVPPAPGKWSPAQIACHLADCELVFGFRLRQTLAEDGPAVQPFDQDKWAATYDGIPASEAAETFSALRRWNLRLIQTALPQAAERTIVHPERGPMTFQTIIETMAGHDLNHLGQLGRMAVARSS